MYQGRMSWWLTLSACHFFLCSMARSVARRRLLPEEDGKRTGRLGGRGNVINHHCSHHPTTTNFIITTTTSIYSQAVCWFHRMEPSITASASKWQKRINSLLCRYQFSPPIPTHMALTYSGRCVCACAMQLQLPI